MTFNVSNNSVSGADGSALTLQLGQVEETVTVAGTAALVETRNPGIGQVITNQQVLELPLNSREFYALALTAPRVLPRRHDRCSPQL